MNTHILQWASRFVAVLGLMTATCLHASQFNLAIDAIQATNAKQPVTFGMVFGAREVPYDEAFQATIAIDGAVIPLEIQIDRKASHCNDDSFEFQPKNNCPGADRFLRHAIFSAVLPSAIPQGQRANVTLNTGGTENTGSTIGFPSSLHVRTEVSIGSTTWVADLEDAKAASLDGELPLAGFSGAAATEWLSGTIAREWILKVPFVNSSDPSQMHEHLVARYHVRHYPGSQNARVDTVVENNWSFTPNHQSYEYSAKIFINDILRYEDPALNHLVHARWKISLWEENYPELQVVHDPYQLIDSRAVPNYSRELIGNISTKTRNDYDETWDSIKPSVAGGVLRYNDKHTYCFKNEFSGYTDFCDLPTVFPVTLNTIGPMGIGKGIQRYMKTTGGRPDIAPLPEWTTVALLDQRYSAYKMTMANADGAGSWPIHLRDENTDRVLSLRDRPQIVIAGSTGTSSGIATCNRSADCLRPYVADSAHQPSMVFYPYLVTGDYFYLEELQFWATYNAARKNTFVRGQDKGLLETGSQTRAQGWSLRTLAQTAFITPDNNSLKEFYLYMLKSNIDDYTAIYVSDPSQSNTFGMVHPYSAAFPVASPWMQDYLGWSSGYTANLGYDSMKPFAQWKGKFPVQRMGFDNSNYCWIYAANYHLFVGPKEEKRLESTTASTVTVRHSMGTGTINPQVHFRSINDVWVHSNQATNGGYKMVGGGVINTLASCGSSEMGAEIGLSAGKLKYDSSATNLASQMRPALAVAVDVESPQAAEAWNRFMARTSPPSYKSSPQWAIDPLAVSSGNGGPLPTNGYASPDLGGVCTIVN